MESSLTRIYYQVQTALGFLPSCVQTLSRAAAEPPAGQPWQEGGCGRGWPGGGRARECQGPEEERVEASLLPTQQLCNLTPGQDKPSLSFLICKVCTSSASNT